MNILIVDDDIRLARAMGGALLAEGHKVCQAASYEEGLLLLATWRPDLLLVDFHLHGYLHDGRDLATVSKQADPGRRVVLISGEIDPSYVEQIHADPNVDLYLQKPVDLHTLISLVLG